MAIGRGRRAWVGTVRDWWGSSVGRTVRRDTVWHGRWGAIRRTVRGRGRHTRITRRAMGAAVELSSVAVRRRCAVAWSRREPAMGSRRRWCPREPRECGGTMGTGNTVRGVRVVRTWNRAVGSRDAVRTRDCTVSSRYTMTRLALAVLSFLALAILMLILLLTVLMLILLVLLAMRSNTVKPMGSKAMGIVSKPAVSTMSGVPESTNYRDSVPISMSSMSVSSVSVSVGAVVTMTTVPMSVLTMAMTGIAAGVGIRRRGSHV